MWAAIMFFYIENWKIPFCHVKLHFHEQRALCKLVAVYIVNLWLSALSYILTLC